MKTQGSSHSRARVFLGWLITVCMAAGLLAGCSNNEPKTHAIKSWDEVQTTIDGARSSDVIDLSKLTAPTGQLTITIPQNMNFSFIGNKDVTFVGVAIDCEGGNVISIEDLHLVSTNNQAQSTLGFKGWGNQLSLTGENSLVNAQAADDISFGAAVGVSDGTTLTISGAGSLIAQGGSSAAGIGGGAGRAAGSLMFREGTVWAFGGNLGENSGGAGIGGGRGGAGGTVQISGGEIRATGGYGAAGIGGGRGGAGGSLEISGGIVYADGDGSGCGIGRGSEGEGITLKMSGGSLTAVGRADAFDAIGGSIQSLPGAYRWWAGSTSQCLLDAETLAPDQPFMDNGGRYFVRIETR